ncbi:acyl-CoA reductase [Leptospira santarosai]|uniref:acyl-CoA reductase n=2 Tax=Leptospira santarosai TaxID=28183 RepID=UPI001E401885|nr:acyl-CoA reductase [Leptospira santarosai]
MASKEIEMSQLPSQFQNSSVKAKEKNVKLPFVIHGKAIKPESDNEQFIASNSGNIIFPKYETFRENFRKGKNPLAETSVQDIIGFLFRVGKLWENEEYIRRRMYIKQMCEYLGYSEKMAITEADFIGSSLRGGSRLWDTLDVELGNRHILDSWIKIEDSEVKAFPKGLMTHVLSGNAPIAVLLSILRSILTKNQTVVKVASGDPITPTHIAQSFLDVDNSHPVSQSIHTVYWPPNSSDGADFLRLSDGICVWGGAEALKWVHKNTAPGIEIISFGPKRSLSIIQTDNVDLEIAARLVAHDICMYDQEACFSTQNVFVLGDVKTFSNKLAEALVRYDKILPSPQRTIDETAKVLLSRLHNDFLGNEISASPENAWQVISSDPTDNIRHPGSRTAFVHSIASVSEIYKYVDSSVQTVAVYPWNFMKEFREELAKLGISRIVECGSSGVYRLGATHDGMYPITRFVRYVSMEAPSEVYPKGMTIPMNMSKIIEYRQFRDLFI